MLVMLPAKVRKLYLENLGNPEYNCNIFEKLSQDLTRIIEEGEDPIEYGYSQENIVLILKQKFTHMASNNPAFKVVSTLDISKEEIDNAITEAILKGIRAYEPKKASLSSYIYFWITATLYDLAKCCTKIYKKDSKGNSYSIQEYKKLPKKLKKSMTSEKILSFDDRILNGEINGED